MVRRSWTLILGMLIGGGFYLLLVDITSSPELYVLAAVAIICGVALELSREQGFVEARISLRWLLGAWRILIQIGAAIPVLCWEALVQLVAPRPVRGTFRAVRFRAGADTPPNVGRRALTEWFGSLAPNTIVVGVDPERDLLLVHQLPRRGDPDQIDPLGLG
jgi:hypothetical protein